MNNNIQFDDNNITSIQNPNFEITKGTVFKNILKYVTCDNNHENCIWFRNNGEIWHTLYSIESGYKELKINGQKHVIFLPHLIIHIGKNKFKQYEVEIYFQNNRYKSDEIIESFLKVDSTYDFGIEKSNYVEESTLILQHLLYEYDFEYNDVDTIKTSKNKFFENMTLLNYTLTHLIEKWKKNIDEYDNPNIYHNMLINQNNNFIPSNKYTKKKYFMGILFEVMKNIKFGNKKYIVYDIKCRNEKEIEKSLADDFYNDNIFMIDTETNKKVILPLKKIIESKYKLFENGVSIIDNKIKIGNYLIIDNVITSCKIHNMVLNKEKYSIDIFTNRKTSRNYTKFSYNLLDHSHNITAIDIYDIIGIKDKQKKYPLFSIKGTIISTINNSKKYYFHELFDYLKLDKYYNKKLDCFMKIEIGNAVFIQMLDRIARTQNIKSDTKAIKRNTYSFMYLPFTSDRKLIKNSDDLFVDQKFIHITTPIEALTSTTENIDNKNIYDSSINLDKFIVKEVQMPCDINKIENINSEDIYISHFTEFLNRKIRITKIYVFNERNMSLNIDFITVDDMEKHTIPFSNFDYEQNFCISKRTTIEGLQIGQYGKISNLGAVNGFKKSLFHGIKDFYERYDGKKMVLFENNIAVHVDLINIEHFNTSSKRLREKNKNNVFLSRYDLLEIKQSSKMLGQQIIHAYNTVRCEII